MDFDQIVWIRLSLPRERESIVFNPVDHLFDCLKSHAALRQGADDEIQVAGVVFHSNQWGALEMIRSGRLECNEAGIGAARAGVAEEFDRERSFNLREPAGNQTAIKDYPGAGLDRQENPLGLRAVEDAVILDFLGVSWLQCGSRSYRLQ